jgi:DNA (cytosine-5)-methyltransferase 1
MERKLTVGSLFAGIGGIDLGLELTGGFRTVWQVEIDPYARKVLEKHWPDVIRWSDIRTFPCVQTAVGRVWHRQTWAVDLICGGFPCQDISNAGKRAGIDGARSGLWSEYRRIIRLLRPKYILVENVAALLGRGLGRVLGDLSACGYDAEWQCIPAEAVGAPHFRDRIFILAYPNRCGCEACRMLRPRQSDARRSGASISNANRNVLEESPNKRGIFRLAENNWWLTEPDVGRVAHGIPARVDRLRCLGNAVVPQVAQWIGERILEAERLTA